MPIGNIGLLECIIGSRRPRLFQHRRTRIDADQRSASSARAERFGHHAIATAQIDNIAYSHLPDRIEKIESGSQSVIPKPGIGSGIPVSL